MLAVANSVCNAPRVGLAAGSLDKLHDVTDQTFILAIRRSRDSSPRGTVSAEVGEIDIAPRLGVHAGLSEGQRCVSCAERVTEVVERERRSCLLAEECALLLDVH